MIEVAVNCDGSSHNFSPVCYCSTINLSVSPGEESLDPGCGEFMIVARFVDKQDNVSNLRNHILLSPGDSDTMSGVFLYPERTEHGESHIPFG